MKTLARFLLPRSLRGSMLAAFVLLSVMSAGAVAAASILIGVRTSRSMAQDQMVADVELNQQAIHNWLDERHRDLHIIANNPYDRGNLRAILADSDSVADPLLGRFAIEDHFTEVFLLNAEGRVALSTNPDNVGINHLHQAHFQQGMKGDYISQTFYTDGTHQIIISVPVQDESGAAVGVLAGRLPIADLTRVVLSRASFTETGQVYLVSSNRQFITDLRFPAQAQLAASDGIDQALNEQNGHGVYSNYNQVRVIGAYRWLPNLGVALISEREEAEALSGIWRLVISIAAITLLALLMAVIASRLLTVRITRPVFALVEVAEAITESDLSRPALVVNAPQEIKSLARAFNSMTVSLQEMIHSLEERVVARTRDLQVAADVSRQISTILDLNELLQQVTILTASSFNLYACFVLIPDADNTYLIQTAGTDADGNPIKPGGVGRIPMDLRPSIITLAARTLQPALINDVLQSPEFLPVADLPETRSELAIPMRLGDRLLGVFDLQSRRANRFSVEDMRVLTALADQIAIAIRNAQLFAETQVAKEQAEQANRVKSMFLATMSHELRTPLNGILNFTRFVADGLLGPVNAKQVDALRKTEASSNHLLALINDVLDISKIESGSLKLFIEDNVQLKDELTSLVATTESLLRNKPVQVIVNIQPDLPAISCDKRRIRQIMLNILSNACKFTTEGSITLTAHPVAHELVLSVKDTGPGIAREDHAAVFETFRQTETGLHLGEGTGLGMPISQRLAEAHGGRMWIESKKGAGATFYVALPLNGKKGT